MPSVALYTSPLSTPHTANPLPKLLHTPSGLAILEIQGTINFPNSASDTLAETLIGRLEFPLYSANTPTTDEKWMKKVYFYVGQYQRLVGEVRQLAKPLAVIRKREEGRNGNMMEGVEGREEVEEELEIVEVVRLKIVFQGRPEPVSVEDEHEVG